ncbi:(glutamine-N5) methyltransferase, ribosomal protein L3-specific family protein [Aeromicrobium marinum DSM 15272]|uniref:(Glutamine-N5) methyltransferase, ribosomal protein L3-specific family protein n=1 Tax=Aeromicrobium marinum DSM 15272 TaxID=585531 RepID=E2S7V7_9ACTN|nr:class I SAM-dependent methyltransferase [Aeromicrobium marinum]EFQ84773.1 (glutamine-N5) methyltransferase, ribosomal protein L3-specific family protein [Aeromicrobium marinum DSM 15272]
MSVQPADPRTMLFDGLEIAYDQHVLEPRPWTIAQAEWVAEAAAEVPPGPMLELFAGVGHIGLAAARRRGRILVQVEIDRWAAQFAHLNAETAGLSDLVEVRCAPVESALAPDEAFPLILADPPWVDAELVHQYPADPRLCIDGGADGLQLVRAALEVIGAHLVTSGLAVLQVGPTQVPAVREAVEGLDTGLSICEVREFNRGALVGLTRRPA